MMIMKTLLLIIALLCFGFQINAQQHSYNFLVDQYCQEAKKIDLDHLNKNEILKANIELGKELRRKYADTIEYIIQHIQSENDTLTQLESISTYSQHYIHDIIYNCDTYLKINRKIIKACPIESKSMQYIIINVNDYLGQHPEFTYKQVLDSAGYMGFVYGKDIPKQLQKDYDFEFVYPNILIEHLLHKSDIYFKAWLYNQSMKLFE